MKYALTIYQPYASLIIAGVKPYEFRSWNFMERGFVHLAGERIIIHASARAVKIEAIGEALEQLADQERHGIINATQACTGEVLLRHWRDYPEKLPTTAAVGTAIIEAPIRKPAWDNYGWPVKEPEAFDKPTPAKGAQGFWLWEHDPAPNGHRCVAIGCSAMVPPDKLCCFRHWLCVPRKLQREIYRTYESRHANVAYFIAVKKARDEIARFEGIEMVEAASA